MKKIILTESQLKKLVTERHQYQSNEQEEENPFSDNSGDMEGETAPAPEEGSEGFSDQEISPEEQLELVLQDLTVYLNTAEDEPLTASREKFAGLGGAETTDPGVKLFVNGLVRVIDGILEERKNSQEDLGDEGDDISNDMDAPVEENPGLNVQNEINESVEKIKADFKRFL